MRLLTPMALQVASSVVRSMTDRYSIDATTPAAMIHSSMLMIWMVWLPASCGRLRSASASSGEYDAVPAGNAVASPCTATAVASGRPPRNRAWTSLRGRNAVG